ncbi:hypothetical protein Tco_0940309 [Tanacetum coccineum]|uniref:Uncharacterized protein n=1 Tax=Tanacetum coccineum TaxID=301880 RepID=A0ABQ5DN78_9ASTR
MNELTNQSSDYEIFCPKERMKELELRTQRRNNFEEELFKDRFAQRDDEVVFRMPQRTKELDLLSSLEKDKFEAFFVENLKVRKKGFKHVIEKRKGLYLMRKSLEILRKFHWMILGGRFNQLSHVSSPLLSKPGEY